MFLSGSNSIAHNETNSKGRNGEKLVARSFFLKRKKLIVSDTFVSKPSTLFGANVHKGFNKQPERTIIFQKTHIFH